MKNLTDVYIALLVNNEEWIREQISKNLGKKLHNLFSDNRQEILPCYVAKINQFLFSAAKLSQLDSDKIRSYDNFQKGQLSDFIINEIKKCQEQEIVVSDYLKFIRGIQECYLQLFQKVGLESNNIQVIDEFTRRFFDEFESDFINSLSIHPGEKGNIRAVREYHKIIEERDRYLTAFENIYAPTVLLDNEHKIENFNAATACLFPDLEISESILSDNSDLRLTLTPIKDDLLKFNKSSRNHLSFETTIETSIGKRYFKVALKKMFDADRKYSGTVIMLEDLTTYKEAEQNLQEAKTKAEEADQLKTAFLANMSHEIRTPMNAVLGFTELMLNANYSRKERTEFLQLIRKSSHDLLTIIEDIIDIAKMESKQLKIKHKVCNPYETLNDLYILFKENNIRYGIHKDVELRLKVDEAETKIKLYTDPERLKQVLSNLLNNAIKFTSKGYIEFGYRLFDDSSIFFFVRDTGDGIPEAMQNKIFDRFVQIDHDSEKSYRGAGLGLAICKNIINLMGGKIWVESVENKGSDFYFLLPRREVPEEIIKDRSDAGNLTTPEINFKNRTILIAEDDEINFIYLFEILKNYGARILRAKNGLEAINIAEAEEKIDIILMDVKMPVVDGLEATQYITKVRPQIPIIAQTAFAMNGDQQKCLDAGCLAYISKPVDQQKLLRTIMKFLLSMEEIPKIQEITK